MNMYWKVTSLTVEIILRPQVIHRHSSGTKYRVLAALVMVGQRERANENAVLLHCDVVYLNWFSHL